MPLSAPKYRTLTPRSLVSRKQRHQRTCYQQRNLFLVATFRVRASVLSMPASQLTCDTLDHMLSLEWTASEGWLPPRITPYQNLSLDPATCVFHYAFECFEGMKAYKDKDGNIRLFRPDRNMARLNKSSARIALPSFDGDALIDIIGKFVKTDKRFIPE
jgi:hypothetical protein